MRKNVKEKNSEWKFIFYSSLFITVLAFVPYVAQILHGAVVTYFKSNDMHLAMYPELIRIQNYFETGKFYGVDLTTFNGASEFFLRANMSGYYLPNWLIIPLSYMFSTRTALAFFHMVHIFVYCFFSQKLCSKYFGLNKYLSLVVVSSYLWIVLFETWTTQFFIIAIFTLPMLYFLLSSLEKDKWIWYMASSLMYVFVFTCGYVTLSVALVVINIIVGLGYSYASDGLSFKKILKVCVAPLIATAVCFGYYWQTLEYANTVAGAETSIADAFFYKQGLRDVFQIISRNILSVEGTEQTCIATIGIIWAVIFLVCVKERVYSKMNKFYKCCYMFGIISYLTIWLISLCDSTAVGILFYSLVPILGSMHIPMRYLIILMPYLFISLAIGIKFLSQDSGNAFYKKSAYVVAAVGVIYLGIDRFVNTDKIIRSSNGFMLEIIVAVFILAGFYYVGNNNKKVLLFWSLTLIFEAVGNFYLINEVSAPENTFEERSIVYSDNLTERLDSYVAELPEKEIYRYISYDSSENVPVKIPSNFGWYSCSDYNLCNYFGYNISLAVPDEYKSVVGWFNMPDWEYVLSTRGDFIILDQNALDEKMELFSEIINWEKPVWGLDGTRMIFTLNKYIPFLYADGLTGEENSHIKDELPTLDNGYFYSPDLTNDDIVLFESDEATYFRINFNANISTRWALLVYPNRYYKYYIDGEEIEPKIYKKQAYFEVENGGTHEIYIEYENPYAKVTVIIFIMYYVLCFLIIIIYLLSNVVKRVMHYKMHERDR